MAYPLLECPAAYAADRDDVPVTLSHEAPHSTTDMSDPATMKDHTAAADRDTTTPDHEWDGANHNDPLDFHNDPDSDHDHDHH